MTQAAQEMRQRFIEGMSRAAATVSVVSTDGPAGRRGVTVSAMTAVSADSQAPSLLVCINKSSSAAEAIRANGVFCVNVLRDEHIAISEVFAGRKATPSGDRFDCTEWTTLRSAAPAVKDALVAFDCQLKQAYLYGSHWILVGELNDISINDGRHPLIYANRAYGIPAPLPPAGPVADRKAGLAIGCSSNFGPFFLGDLLVGIRTAFEGVDTALVEGMQPELVRAVEAGELDFAITHSHKLPAALEAVPLAELEPFCLLPSRHALSSNESVTLEELSEFPMVLLDQPPIGDLILGYFRDQGLNAAIGYRTKSLEMARSLVGSGLGYSILFTKPASNMSYDGKAITVRSIARPLPPMEIAMVRRRGAQAGPFFDFVEQFFRSRFSAPDAATPEARRRAGPQ